MAHGARELAHRLRDRRAGVLDRIVSVALNPTLFLALAIAAFVAQQIGLQLGVLVGTLILLALVAMFIDGLSRPIANWHWTNETLDERIKHLVTLLGMARSRVVFVTGSLHHDLFEKPEVVRALARLPKRVKIVVYHERPIDPETKLFRQILDSKECKFIPITADCIPHGAVIDGKHCKVEEFGVRDSEKIKHVDYYAYDPDRAREMNATIERVARASKASRRVRTDENTMTV